MAQKQAQPQQYTRQNCASVISTKTVIHPEKYFKGKHSSVTVHSNLDQLTGHAIVMKVLTKHSKQELCLSGYGMPQLIMAFSPPEAQSRVLINGLTSISGCTTMQTRSTRVYPAEQHVEA